MARRGPATPSVADSPRRSAMRADAPASKVLAKSREETVQSRKPYCPPSGLRLPTCEVCVSLVFSIPVRTSGRWAMQLLRHSGPGRRFVLLRPPRIRLALRYLPCGRPRRHRGAVDLRMGLPSTLELIILPYPVLRTERQLPGGLRIAKTEVYPKRSS